MNKAEAKRTRFKFPCPTDPTAALIKRRRLQMLVHSCLYYQLDAPMLDDATFDRWAKELAALLTENPGLYSDHFDKHFVGWEGITGYALPHRDPWVFGAAQRLMTPCTESRRPCAAET